MKNSTKECEQRMDIAEIVRRWGGPASNAVLDPSFEIFRTSDIEGVIGYRTALKHAVVLGDPICAPNTLADLTLAFHEFCKEKGWSVIYIAASTKFEQLTLNNSLCKAKIRFGDESYLDPGAYPHSGSNGRLLKKKVRHAQGENVTVEEYKTHDAGVEEAIEQAANAWLKGRRGPQIYMSHVHLFSDNAGKRWFYAKQNEKIVGVLLLNQLELYQGWLLNLLMPTPNSPSGTSEILALSAFDTLNAEGCHYISFGITPGMKLEDFHGLNPFSIWLAHLGYKAADKIFHLEGRRKFWEKFEPQTSPSYVLFSESKIRFGDVLAIMRALNVSVK